MPASSSSSPSSWSEAPTYVDGSSLSWAYGLAQASLVITLLITPIICVFLWRRQHIFPLNSTPIFLLILTQLGAAWYVISLLQSIALAATSMPCWLHFCLSLGDIFPFFPGTMLQLYRNACLHRIQQSLAADQQEAAKTNSQTTKTKKKIFLWGSLVTREQASALIGDGVLKKVTLGWLGAAILLLIVQLATRSSAVLNGPMIATECLAYPTGFERVYTQLLWWSLIALNILFAYLMRTMDDAFNLNKNWKKILYFFAWGAPLNAVATVAQDLPPDVRLNAYCMGQLAFVGACLCYIWFASISPLRQSFLLRGGGNGNDVVPLDIASQREATSVSSTAAMRVLLNNREIVGRFKQYLVKEFCVENILFLQDLAFYRGISSTTHPAEKKAALQKILVDYFVDGAAYEINVKHSLRQRVVQQIVEGKGPTEPTNGEGQQAAGSGGALNDAEEEVLRMLIDPYNRFVKAVGCLLAARRGSISKMDNKEGAIVGEREKEREKKS